LWRAEAGLTGADDDDVECVAHDANLGDQISLTTSSMARWSCVWCVKMTKSDKAC
jgi:hypothetical protein